MNRRFLLASIATLSASRVVAQTMKPPAPAPSVTTDAQQTHLRDTMAVGSLSLLLSRAALPKVTHPLLKQFAQFEIAEQETVADVLKAIQTNAAPKGAIQAPSDADLMQNLDDAGKASVEKLRASMREPNSIETTFATKSRDTGSSSTFRKFISRRPTIWIRPMSRNLRAA
jgi:hypothetical protein